MYKHFDDMCWPVPDKEMYDLNWKLRYQQGPLDIKDRLVAASIISAYGELINKTQRKRNYIVEKIKKGQ